MSTDFHGFRQAEQVGGERNGGRGWVDVDGVLAGGGCGGASTRTTLRLRISRPNHGGYLWRSVFVDADWAHRRVGPKRGGGAFFFFGCVASV